MLKKRANVDQDVRDNTQPFATFVTSVGVIDTMPHSIKSNIKILYKNDMFIIGVLVGHIL